MRVSSSGMDAESSVGEMAVSLFPLPNVVLFPRAVLPLHVFEPRYRRMTADALVAQKRLAMALLKPGWERDYYGSPEIEPVVCVGRIVNSELLPDGRYNLLLQGEMRACVEKETSGSSNMRWATSTPKTAPASCAAT